MRKAALVAVLLCGVAYAEEQKPKMPPYLKGAEYKVILKNGKVYTFQAEEMKLVKRKAKKKAPPPPAPKIVERIKEVEVTVNRPTYKPYSVGVYLGRGPARLKVRRKGKDADVIEHKDVVAGLTLGYKLDLDWQLRGTVLSNDTWLFGAAWNFGGEKIK